MWYCFTYGCNRLSSRKLFYSLCNYLCVCVCECEKLYLKILTVCKLIWQICKSYLHGIISNRASNVGVLGDYINLPLFFHLIFSYQNRIHKVEKSNNLIFSIFSFFYSILLFTLILIISYPSKKKLPISNYLYINPISSLESLILYF